MTWDFMHGRRVMRSVSVAMVAAVAIATSACAPPTTTTTTPPSSTAVLPVGGETVTAVVPVGLTVSLAPAAPASVPAAPSGLTFPLGAIHLDVHGVAPGSIATVTVTLSSPTDSVRKLVGGVWDPFTFNGTTGSHVSADGLTVTLELQDGGRGDADGLANGVIVDPFAPAMATSLTITSNDVPTAYVNQPYSFQLQAAGETGAVHWSLPAGGLPTGLSLSDSGLISGIPTGGGFITPVQVVDDVSTATKLLLFGTFGAQQGVTPTGAALPDGSRIFVVALETSNCQASCYSWVGQYLANGTLSSVDTTSVNTYLAVVGGSGLVNASGTRIVRVAFPATPGPATGPVDVLDADTGAVITTLEPSPSFQVDSVNFSPDGSRLLLGDAASSTSRLFDTSDWHLLRTIIGTSSGHGRGAIWSPDSSEFIERATQFPPPPTSSAVHVYSTSDASGAGDRTLDLSALPCSNVTDWSSTGRVAVGCGAALGPAGNSSVATASASDGSNAHLVVEKLACSTPPCATYGLVTQFGLRFSPNGQFLALAEHESATSNPPFPFTKSRIGYVPDVAGSTMTYLTELSGASVLSFPATWR